MKIYRLGHRDYIDSLHYTTALYHGVKWLTLKSGLDLSNSSLAVIELGKLERSLSEALRAFLIGIYNLAR
ncbi:hypothetical protein [Pyrobaculum aerophilum]|uniref:hypothetical protein n=1 Tax=Pyrobaculum aerophilum TaxID=13773 RepID=UPI0011C059AE|nr:hypothetical protein [Pyrobaculum aerophilum]